VPIGKVKLGVEPAGNCLKTPPPPALEAIKQVAGVHVPLLVLEAVPESVKVCATVFKIPLVSAKAPVMVVSPLMETPAGLLIVKLL